MRRRVHQVLSGVVVVLMLSMVTAVGQDMQILKGTIPFNFHVGRATMPAGEYIVKLATSPTWYVQIRSINGANVALVLTLPLITGNSTGAPKLVFNRYGSSYFLSKVVCPKDNIGRELMKEKLERELAASVNEVPSTEIALEKR